MRLCLWLAILSPMLVGCDDLPSTSSQRVLEVRCVVNAGFDANKLCMKPERPGAELEIRVNANTQKVLISIVKNDGNWFSKDYILDMCSVVDSRNWKCTEKPIGNPGGPVYMVRDYGMVHGRFYTSLTGGAPPDYYTSSVSGLTFWELYYGLITWPDALSNTGYSPQLVAEVRKRK
jgi:hypothetical protein